MKTFSDRVLLMRIICLQQPQLHRTKEGMKRKTVEDYESPNYPSFKKFHKNRREFLSTLGLGAAGMALTSSCVKEPELGGVICEPDDFPALEGDIATAEPPPAKSPEAHTAGIPAEPEQPEIPIKLGGEIVAPQPPKVDPEPPRIKGKIAPAQPPEKKTEKVPALPGRMPPPKAPIKKQETHQPKQVEKEELPEPTPRLMGLICPPRS